MPYFFKIEEKVVFLLKQLFFVEVIVKKVDVVQIAH